MKYKFIPKSQPNNKQKKNPKSTTRTFNRTLSLLHCMLVSEVITSIVIGKISQKLWKSLLYSIQEKKRRKTFSTLDYNGYSGYFLM